MPQEQKQKRKIILNWEAPSQKHIDWINSPATLKGAVGGKGSAKTRMLVFQCLLLATESPRFIGTKIGFFGLTEQHVKDLIVPEFKAVLTNMVKGRNIGAIENKDYTIAKKPWGITLWNGTEIVFRTLQAGQGNTAGFNFSACFLDECLEVPHGVFQEVRDRARTVPDAIVCWTQNPGTMSHWAYEHHYKFLDENKGQQPENQYLGYFSMHDNKFLDDSYKKAQEDQYGYSAIARLRNIEGKFCSLQGLVYSEFSREANTYDPNKQSVGHDWETFGGLDFGWRDPSSFCLVAVDKSHEKPIYYVYFNHYKAGMTIEEHSKVIKRPVSPTIRRPTKIWSDHYSESVQTYRSFGVDLTLADKSAGTLLNGISLINQLFYERRLFIRNDLKDALREAESYRWASAGRNNTGKDVPVDSDNHFLDSLRYVISQLESRVSFTTLSFQDYKQEQIKAVQVPQFTGYDFQGNPVWS